LYIGISRDFGEGASKKQKIKYYDSRTRDFQERSHLWPYPTSMLRIMSGEG
jgi:hypothetical protein